MKSLTAAQDMASAYHYLVALCPDTKTAVAKLRQIRAKVRERRGDVGGR